MRRRQIIELRGVLALADVLEVEVAVDCITIAVVFLYLVTFLRGLVEIGGAHITLLQLNLKPHLLLLTCTRSDTLAVRLLRQELWIDARPLHALDWV